jgi:hypothetical protein
MIKENVSPLTFYNMSIDLEAKYKKYEKHIIERSSSESHDTITACNNWLAETIMYDKKESKIITYTYPMFAVKDIAERLNELKF